MFQKKMLMLSEMGKHEVHFVHNKCVFQLSAPYILSLITFNSGFVLQDSTEEEKRKKRYSTF